MVAVATGATMTGVVATGGNVAMPNPLAVGNTRVAGIGFNVGTISVGTDPANMVAVCNVSTVATLVAPTVDGWVATIAAGLRFKTGSKPLAPFGELVAPLEFSSAFAIKPTPANIPKTPSPIPIGINRLRDAFAPLRGASLASADAAG